MSVAEHIKASLELPRLIVESYVKDLSEAELLIRPHVSMNHIAWQWGHLIASEHSHVHQVCPGSMPPLPPGFAEAHTRETASIESNSFLTKAEYMAAMDAQRAGTFAALDSLSDEQLAAESPESIRYFGRTVGSVFSGEATHWMMHAGQWAVIRRQLGKPPLF